MEILEDIFSCLLVVFIASIPIAYVWVLYYRIKCWKVDLCTNRKCKYWEWCNHNYVERKKDEIELRKQNLIRSYRSTENRQHNKQQGKTKRDFSWSVVSFIIGINHKQH